MKQFIFFIAMITCYYGAFSQTAPPSQDTTSLYCITQNDGSKLVGRILSNDSREVKIKTAEGREIIIPQYIIKSITKTNFGDLNEKGEYVGKDNFCTRYFITTNGLPLEKGKNYIQWNLFGPDFQFNVTDHVGMGIMTSWIGMPVIGTIKYSNSISDDVHYAFGGLVGTGSWAAPGVGGALPFAAITFGTGRSNLSFSGGYGAIWNNGSTAGRALASVAGMHKISRKVSLVFDSFFMLAGADKTYTSYGGYTQTRSNPGIAIIIPGVRIHQTESTAFQFGFAGVFYDNELLPVPLPMVQWYRSF